ncbi:MAG TPA: xanthine dehydrogenase family protein subunit M [Thermoleophilaceae bacterium]|jgi:carbon-monoxide dehydrogenase medium subunit
MKPASFEHIPVTSVDEALAALDGGAGEAKVLAGGQSLVPMMNLRLALPATLVDLNPVTGLDYVEETPDGISIGAMTRQRTVERSEVVMRRVPLLSAALRHVGHFQIRNRGTVGGSIAHADAAAELPAVLLATGGSVTVVSAARGPRAILAADLFRGHFETSIEPDELLTEVHVPAPANGARWGFREFARRHGDYALAGVAVVTTGAGADIDEAAVSLFGVGTTPVRAAAAEREIVATGSPEAAATAVVDEIEPTGHIHGSGDYRRYLAGRLTRRAVAEAIGGSPA